MTISPGPTRRQLGLGAAIALAATACGARGADGPPAAADPAPAQGFPLEVHNCEAPLTFDEPPQRVVLLESAPVTALDGLGVLDRIVARAGVFPPAYYDGDLAARIEQIPVLSEDIDASGHIAISQEVVIAQRPDLVLGQPDGVTRAGLAAAGAELLVQDVYCGTLTERADFRVLTDTITQYGRIFAVDQRAEELCADLAARVDAARSHAAALPSRTAAALYPSVGGGPLYAYGSTSMVTAQFDALGLTTVFEDTPTRVFEVGDEALLAADPDVVVLLHQGQDDGRDLLAGLAADPTLGSLPAIAEGRVLPLLFNFCEPASPLVVDGLERIGAWLQDLGGA